VGASMDRNGAVGSNRFPTLNFNVNDTIRIALRNDLVYNTGFGPIAHNLLIKTGVNSSDPQVTGAINQGISEQYDILEWTPTTAGTYYYLCGHHPNTMNGQIIVSQ